MCTLHNKCVQIKKKKPLLTAFFHGIILEKEVVKVKDIPIFTTEYGVASLFFKEIPYKKQAFIRIRTVQEGFFREHLAECISFCRMAGAETVFAADHPQLESFPLYTSILQMRHTAWVDTSLLENLFPVTEQTVSRWRGIVNERLFKVDASATLTAFDEKEILSSGGAYFVHHDGDLLGVGWIREPELLLMAAVKRGAGERVMHSLMSLVEGSELSLEVASTNRRAISLYERLGFLATAEKTRWHTVFCSTSTNSEK